MMVIAHFVNNDGGVGTVVKNLANRQSLDGNIVYVFVTDLNFSFIRKLNKNVNVCFVEKNYKLPPMLFGNKIFNAYNYLKKMYPNKKIILHAHNFLTVGLLSNIRKLPLVCTIHGISSINHKKSIRTFIQEIAICIIIKKMKRYRQHIIAVSDHTAKYYGDISKVKIPTIHNGTTNRIVNKIDNNKFVFAHLGDISINKGWDKEIVAFSLLKKRYPDLKLQFVFAGKITHMSDINVKKMIIDCGLNEEDAKYLGFIDNIQKELLCYTDVMLLISKSEGLPMTLVESQEMGIPIIATSVGGIPEVVTDNVNGFLVDSNEDHIMNKMEQLMLNHDLYKKMCKKALENYKNNYTLDLMVKRYYNTYKEVN